MSHLLIPLDTLAIQTRLHQTGSYQTGYEILKEKTRLEVREVLRTKYPLLDWLVPPINSLQARGESQLSPAV